MEHVQLMELPTETQWQLGTVWSSGSLILSS